jgi:hypothetical protein
MPRIRLLAWSVLVSVAAMMTSPAHAQVGYLTGSPGKGVAMCQQRSTQGQRQMQGHCGMMMNMKLNGGMNPLGGGGFAGSFGNGNGFSGSSASSLAMPFANGYSQTPNYPQMMMMQQQMYYQRMLMQQIYMMQMMQMQNQYNAGLAQSPYQTALLNRQTPINSPTTQTTAYRQAASLQR